MNAPLCGHTMYSVDDPGHVHTCSGAHLPDGGHMCSTCRRWFQGRS